jgi:hypothetical protein
VPAAWKIGSRNGGTWKLSMKKDGTPEIDSRRFSGSEGVSVEGFAALCPARTCSPAPVSGSLLGAFAFPGEPGFASPAGAPPLEPCASWPCTSGGASAGVPVVAGVSLEASPAAGTSGAGAGTVVTVGSVSAVGVSAAASVAETASARAASSAARMSCREVRRISSPAGS